MRNLKKSFAHILSGSISSQLLLLAATPLLTRLYGPEAFGGLATFTSIYALCAGIGTFRYELAIPSPRNKFQAHALTVATIALATCSATVVIVSLLFLQFLAREKGPNSIYMLMPACMFMIAIHSAIQQWAARTGEYARYSLSLVVSASANAGTALLLAYAGARGTSSLILGLAVGLAAGVGSCLSPKVLVGHARRRIHAAKWLTRALRAAHAYRAFPRYILPSFLFNNVATSGPVIVLGILRSDSEVGYFSLTLRFLMTPCIMLANAASEAIRSEMFRRRRNKLILRPLINSVIAVSLLFCLSFLLVATLFGGDILVYVLGARFEDCRPLIRPLAISTVAAILVQIVQNIFLVLERHRIAFVSQLSLGTLPLIALVALAQGGIDLPSVLLGYALVQGSIVLCLLIAIRRITNQYDQILINNAQVT